MSTQNGNQTPPLSPASLGTKPKRKWTRRKPLGVQVGDYVIQKGVPIPPPQPRHKYPWDAMEPGDSFFVAKPSTSLAGGVAARNKERKDGKEFTSRKENGGLRIWRVK